MRSRRGTRTTLARRLTTIMAAVGALLISSGIALMATPTSASAADQCVPKAAYTETTGWVSQSPGAGWTQVDSRVKTAATEGHWTDLVWHNYTGNDPAGTPSLDDPNWHAVPADPQAENHTVPPRVPNVPYNVSNENSGRGSWFLWTGTWVPGAGAVYEYRFSFDHPAVTCETEAFAAVQWIEPDCGTKAGYDLSSGDPVDVTWSPPSADPAPGVTVSLTATATEGYSFAGLTTRVFTHTFSQVVPPPGQTYSPETGVCAAVAPPVVSPPAVSPPTTTTTTTTQVSPPKAKTHTTVKAEATTPTVVQAGLAGEAGSSSGAGLGLTAAGLLLLAGAGGLVLRARGRRAITA